jgi:predicted ATP-dependent endonuclease of OLD family
MKVRELTVTNFRGFAGERRFQLSDRFAVIAGINGRGKSSLLDGRYQLWDREQSAELPAFSFDANGNLQARPGGQL